MAIDTLEAALKYIDFLGGLADVCTRRETGKICGTCKCGKKPITLMDLAETENIGVSND